MKHPPTHEEINTLAGLIWLAELGRGLERGALTNWLTAETLLRDHRHVIDLGDGLKVTLRREYADPLYFGGVDA